MLEVGEFKYSMKEVLLEENERIVGVRSKYHSDYAIHCDLQFMIAKLD